MKFNFLDALAKFWDLQGTPLRKLPIVNGQAIDLHSLYTLVDTLGGYEKVSQQRGQWSHVARMLGLKRSSAQQSLASLVKQKYGHVVPFRRV